ncbi:MAG: hypothetical protein ACRED5_09615 [Propylenella sp.]
MIRRKAGLADVSQTIDLLGLFHDGVSGGLSLGSTAPADLQKVSGHDDDAGGRGPVPFSSWITCINDGEFYFQGTPPYLYGLKLTVSPYAMGWGGGRLILMELKEVVCGELKFVVGEFSWSELLMLPTALHFAADQRFDVKGGDEKTIWFENRANDRVLSFEYRIEPAQRENGIYEFDYFLHAVRLIDWEADETLSLTLGHRAKARE